LEPGALFTTITLNRPECHSALDREVSTELNARGQGDLRRPDGVCTGGGLRGTAKIAKFAGRRKAKEWNLIGRLDRHARRSACSR
jgi:hypothetical protein